MFLSIGERAFFIIAHHFYVILLIKNVVFWV
jgi:hypothetical protein